jgi:hypothetical protein
LIPNHHRKSFMFKLIRNLIILRQAWKLIKRRR